eukprot:GILI01043355.1.p1 GENE.GILI01043355.1~~GILI01043355.1.p1  ORF type:complete len:197 (+),score=29.42 GILI01043355.1:1-591(+)
MEFLYFIVVRQMSSLTRANSPDLATTFTCTVLQFTVLFLGFINFNSVLSFCQAANKSKEHPWIKNTLIMIMYLYAPVSAISIAFSWISWDQDWSVGWFFIWFPFLLVVFYFLVVFATKNDISHFIDVHRLSRAKLPAQAPPRPILVGAGNKTPPRAADYAMSPPRHSIIDMDRYPPVAPQTEERAGAGYLDDDDAF